MGYEIDITPDKIRVWYRGFLVRGFMPGEAANMVASLMGIRGQFKRQWTLKELQKLDFIKHTPTSP